LRGRDSRRFLLIPAAVYEIRSLRTAKRSKNFATRDGPAANEIVAILRRKIPDGCGFTQGVLWKIPRTVEVTTLLQTNHFAMRDINARLTCGGAAHDPRRGSYDGTSA